jgi:hypothetical protein
MNADILKDVVLPELASRGWPAVAAADALWCLTVSLRPGRG